MKMKQIIESCSIGKLEFCAEIASGDNGINLAPNMLGWLYSIRSLPLSIYFVEETFNLENRIRM